MWGRGIAIRWASTCPAYNYADEQDKNGCDGRPWIEPRSHLAHRLKFHLDYSNRDVTAKCLLGSLVRLLL